MQILTTIEIACFSNIMILYVWHTSFCASKQPQDKFYFINNAMRWGGYVFEHSNKYGCTFPNIHFDSFVIYSEEWVFFCLTCYKFHKVESMLLNTFCYLLIKGDFMFSQHHLFMNKKKYESIRVVIALNLNQAHKAVNCRR